MERVFTVELNGVETKKDFGDVDSRTMFIHEVGKREKWSNYFSFLIGTERLTKAGQNNSVSQVHIEKKPLSAARHQNTEAG